MQSARIFCFNGLKPLTKCSHQSRWLFCFLKRPEEKTVLLVQLSTVKDHIFCIFTLGCFSPAFASPRIDFKLIGGSEGKESLAILGGPILPSAERETSLCTDSQGGIFFFCWGGWHGRKLEKYIPLKWGLGIFVGGNLQKKIRWLLRDGDFAFWAWRNGIKLPVFQC